jgi:glycosyltransferase involved in cell wall biosynthesis
MLKKILIFIPSIEDGGVEKNLYIIANYLYKNLKYLEIITTSYNKRSYFNSKINFIGPKWKFLLNKGRYLKYFISLIYLIKQIILSKKSLIIFSFQANIFAIFVAKMFGIKIISRSNSSPSGWSNNFVKNKIFNYLLKKADKIIVNSLSFKKEFLQRFNILTTCIYNPFNAIAIKKYSNKKVNFNFFGKKNTNIIAVGRLTDQKDHMTLLKSFLLIRKEMRPKLLIIGKGYMREHLRIFIKQNKLNKNVKLFGYCQNPYPYIKKADIFILPSIFEGLPNVLLEAQFLKKYIISTDCPTGPKEILLNGKAGDLFQIKNYIELSKLINNYKKRNTYNKIKIGFKNLNRFDYELNCKKYLQIIKKFL